MLENFKDKIKFGGEELHSQGTVGEKFAVEILQKEVKCCGRVEIVEMVQLPSSEWNTSSYFHSQGLEKTTCS